MAKKIEFRDVSIGLKKLRDFLLGRKHILHGRFMPMIAPRTIPPPDIPRCPDYKYSDQYYFERNAFDSVKPPVVAPVAEGPPFAADPTKKGRATALKPDAICFNQPPTPGQVWWWDGHCYYEYVDPPPKPVQAASKTDRHIPQCPPSSSPPKS